MSANPNSQAGYAIKPLARESRLATTLRSNEGKFVKELINSLLCIGLGYNIADKFDFYNAPFTIPARSIDNFVRRVI